MTIFIPVTSPIIYLKRRNLPSITAIFGSLIHFDTFVLYLNRFSLLEQVIANFPNFQYEHNTVEKPNLCFYREFIN